jgi:hypothetical protein
MRPILIHGIAITSVACAGGCGTIIQIPEELQGGEQTEPYFCDACNQLSDDDDLSDLEDDWQQEVELNELDK